MQNTAVEPTQDRYPGKVQLSHGDQIEYKAYARDFGLGSVLYLVATCSYPAGPYEIWFEGEQGPGWKWKLMEKAPTIFYNLATYHIASSTSGQPPAELPRSIEVTDGFGTHTVPVNNWE
jgi:hypothetical protein